MKLGDKVGVVCDHTLIEEARAIRAALLWTATLEFMEISVPALDATLASLQVGVSVLDPASTHS